MNLRKAALSTLKPAAKTAAVGLATCASCVACGLGN